MHTIEFVEEHHGQGTDYPYSTIDIAIDGKPLAAIMKHVELPMAVAEGRPDNAGGYGGIQKPALPPLYYLGLEDRYWGAKEDKTAVLDCACGAPGCWPDLKGADPAPANSPLVGTGHLGPPPSG